jgi:hypothetical protein
MVPLADIFNHKASVVELAEGYEVHGAAGSSSSGSDSGGSEGEEDEGEDGEELEESSGSEEGGHQPEHEHHAGCSGDHPHGEACGAAGAAEEHGHGGGTRQALPAVMGSSECSIHGLKTGERRVWWQTTLCMGSAGPNSATVQAAELLLSTTSLLLTSPPALCCLPACPMRPSCSQRAAPGVADGDS